LTTQRLSVEWSTSTPSLFHHFFKPPIADRIRYIPTDAPQDHVTFKMAALELDHLALPLEAFPAIISQSTAMKNLRQNPAASLR
jgi:hypothetical protein